MITYPNNKERLNIQQQVEKNKDDIVRHYEQDRILADYGIRVIGIYDSYEELIADKPDGEVYGNACLVGPEGTPRDVYIWTRANNISDVDYWQDMGPLTIVGPQGPTGPEGPQGIPGVSPNLLVGKGQPTQSARAEDAYVDATTGDLYKITDGQWVKYGNIRGPQGLQGLTGPRGQVGPTGPQGPKGNDGDPGGFIKIGGFFVSEEDLPSPVEIDDTQIAFLVGTESPYNLYIQVGAHPSVAIWHNIGALNLATYVTVGGEFQGIWDADTKLDKVNISDGEYHAYVISDDGSQDTMYITFASDPGALVMRGGNGEIYVPETPTFPNEATSKYYVDSLITDSETITTSWEGPDLKLNLNADLVSDISRAVKTPISSVSAVSLPYLSPQGVVSWQTTKSLITPYVPNYRVGTTSSIYRIANWTGSYPVKTEFYPTTGSGLTTVTVTPASGSATSLGSVYKVEYIAYSAKIHTLLVYRTNTSIPSLYNTPSQFSITGAHIAIDYFGRTSTN